MPVVTDPRERILLLAPTAADAEIGSAILREANLPCRICLDLPALARELEQGAGALLMTDEVLLVEETRELIEVLGKQASWSDVPIVLLSATGADAPAATWAMEQLGNVMVLERPTRITTLVSALRTALRARRRQYVLRDSLQALRQSENLLAGELETMQRLHALSARLIAAPDLRTALEGVLDDCIHATRGSAGAVQLYEPKTDTLELLAQRGIAPKFHDRFRNVRRGGHSACARTMGGERVVIEDTQHDAGVRDLASAVGFRALQSTPLLDRNGELLGVLTTYYPEPHRLSAHDLRTIDLYVRQAADYWDHLRARDALRRSEADLSDFFENANVGLHWVGPDGALLRANQAELDMLGYSREEYIGHHIAEFHLDRPVIDDILHRLLAGEKLDNYPARLRAKDGSIREVLISSSALYEQGQFVHTRCFTLDVTARKQAEESLRRSEQQLRLIIDSLPALVAYVDRDKRYRFFNRTLCEWFGLDPADVHGRTAAEILGEQAYAIVGPKLDQALAGERVHFEAEVPYLHGGTRVTAMDYVPDLRPDGTVDGYIALIHDISERKQAEATQALYAAIVESSDDAIISKDLDGKIMTWNPGAERLFGYAAQEAIGQSISLIIPADKLDEESSIIDNIRQGRRSDQLETVRLDKHGNRIDISLTVSPILNQDGQIIGASKLARNITARKRADAELVRQSERLRLLWEAAAVLLTTEDPDAMMRALFAKIAPHFGLDTYFNFMVNETGDALELASCAGIPNDEAQRIHRLEFGQAVCGTVAQRRHPIVATHIQLSDEPMVQLVKGYGIRAYACNPLMANNELFGTLSFASHTRDEFDTDELEFLKTISRYVTVAYERMRLIRQLRDTDRRKDEFLATLAHELRNPLAPIRNALQIMRLTGNSGAAVEQARAMMERQLGQMVRLIDDLLDVSRITRGKLELRKERIELAGVIQNAVDGARHLIEASGHELILDLPDEPIYLDADPVRLAQVFANLLNNAAKYTDRGGHIWLAVTPEAGAVTVTVRDDGIGVPPEALTRIFDMFTQVNHSLERTQSGLGIGLTLVKRLVEMHGGSIEARSRGVGHGTELITRLPTVSVGSGPRPYEDQPANPMTCRILVADDNLDAAESMGTMLRLMGNEVRTVHDGIQAIEEAAAFRPDVVLLDIGMPRLNGYEAARRIRKHPWGQEMVLVALTGWGQEEDKRRADDAGFNRHFTKPVDPHEVIKFMAELQVFHARQEQALS